MLGALKVYNERIRSELLNRLEQKKFLTPDQRRQFEQEREREKKQQESKDKP